MNKVLIIIKKVCFSILLFLCIILFLSILIILSAKVLAGADINAPVCTEAGEKEIILYYGNEEYISTGNPKFSSLVKFKKTIEINDISLEETIIRELFKSPGKGMMSLIPSNAILLDVNTEFNRAVVNFASENMHGGSLQEAMMLDQIVYSLAVNCDVKEVIFLLDGKSSETLMGHFDISVPILAKNHMIE